MAQSDFTEKIDSDGLEIESTDVMTVDKNKNRFLYYRLKMSIEAYLKKAYEDFMVRIKDRVKNNHLSTDIDMFKQCFKEKEGVVINTFHGIKGEEYTTVIAFGILNGYIPHWDTIINESPNPPAMLGRIG